MARRAVISDPLYCAPSTTTTPSGIPATMAVAHRKILRRGVRAQRKFTDDRAALQHFFVQLLVFLWVADIDARSEHPDSAAVGIHRSLMPDGVDPAGHSADDDHATRGKVPAETLCHLRAVKCRPARSHDAEAGKI